MQGTFRFSFGPWNIHEGADPFGPEVRKSIEFNTKLAAYKKLGFDGIQLHDDDAVPGMENMTPAEIAEFLEQDVRLIEYIADLLKSEPELDEEDFLWKVYQKSLDLENLTDRH